MPLRKLLPTTIDICYDYDLVKTKWQILLNLDKFETFLKSNTVHDLSFIY